MQGSTFRLVQLVLASLNGFGQLKNKTDCRKDKVKNINRVIV